MVSPMMGQHWRQDPQVKQEDSNCRASENTDNVPCWGQTWRVFDCLKETGKMLNSARNTRKTNMWFQKERPASPAPKKKRYKMCFATWCLPSFSLLSNLYLPLLVSPHEKVWAPWKVFLALAWCIDVIWKPWLTWPQNRFFNLYVTVRSSSNCILCARTVC
jgi:hypothetical protein